MKKIIALALSLMMVLTCAAVLAETAEKSSLTMMGSFTIEYDKIPEYYRMSILNNSEEEFRALFTPTDATKPILDLYMAFNDEWYGVNTLADATEEDIIAVKDDFYQVIEADDGDLVFSDVQTGEGTRVLKMLANDGSIGALYCIFNSHEIEIDLLPGTDGEPVTDEEVDALLSFLTDIKFVETK